MLWLIVPLLIAQPLASRPADSVYLFTSFRDKGQDGLHLAWSRDGLTWTALRDGASFLVPKVGTEKLMRDPCIARSPDGTFHMVWTTGWKEQGFGYARSDDLVTWSEQRFIPVEHGVLAEGVRNTWAPELFYDEVERRYLIVWSSTKKSQVEKDHRLYAMWTTDFETFSEPKLLYDPGYRCIDGVILKHHGEYVLFFKDEREDQKVIRMARADQPDGPYGEPSEPLPLDGVEGPSVMRLGERVVLYVDHYRHPRHYTAMASQDLKLWTDLTEEIHFPKGHRHGSVMSIDAAMLKRLQGL